MPLPFFWSLRKYLEKSMFYPWENIFLKIQIEASLSLRKSENIFKKSTFCESKILREIFKKKIHVLQFWYAWENTFLWPNLYGLIRKSTFCYFQYLCKIGNKIYILWPWCPLENIFKKLLFCGFDILGKIFKKTSFLTLISLRN